MKGDSRRQFWAGLLSAVALGWLLGALILGFDEWVFGHRIRHSQFSLLLEFMFVVHLTFLPFMGFAAGFASAFFWHHSLERVSCERWSVPVVSLIFAPVLLLGFQSFALPFFLLPIAFVLALSPFRRGVHVGFRWWHDGYWRQFLGLSNEWQREDDER